jgi:maltose alpha-D-glucosyltransferase/alpha-amylase
LLGKRTAELHRALATETDDPAFKVEETRQKDVKRWAADAARELDSMLKRLVEMRSDLPEAAQSVADKVIAGRRQLERRLRAVEGIKPSGGRSRIHGDYHLGQVLVAQNDVMIIDFEGEPRRSLEERRKKSSPLRDVAGMLRSLDYAAFSALGAIEEGAATADAMRRRVASWREFASREFLESYREHAAGNVTHPSDQAFADALLDMFVIQKAVYEVMYELSNRPAWVTIPLNGLLTYLDHEEQAS